MIAARIGGEQAANGGRAFARQGQGEFALRRIDGLMDTVECGPGFDDDGIGDRIDLADLGHTFERK